jgi:hypothetical protein
MKCHPHPNCQQTPWDAALSSCFKLEERERRRRKALAALAIDFERKRLQMQDSITKEVEILERERSKENAHELEEQERWRRIHEGGFDSVIEDVAARSIGSCQARMMCKAEEEIERKRRMHEETAVAEVGRMRECDIVRVAINRTLSSFVWAFLRTSEVEGESSSENEVGMSGVGEGIDPTKVLALLRSIQWMQSSKMSQNFFSESIAKEPTALNALDRMKNEDTTDEARFLSLQASEYSLCHSPPSPPRQFGDADVRVCVHV